MSANLRNVCIIAHVDHGKTTLVDFLLKQAGTFQEHQAVDDRIMDSMDLERERGITILAKNTSVVVGDTKINIIDTPGHADFGGEVERIMGMSQGAILLVDAAEGPLPQTRFVLEKAIKQGLKIILCINKVDRPEVREGDRIDEVINGAFDLFCDLGATEEQSEFPIVYACGRQGWCTLKTEEIPELLNGKKGDLKPLFDLILDYIEPPVIEEGPARLLISNLDYSEWVGQMGVGRVYSGEIKKGDRLISKSVDSLGKPVNRPFTVSKVLSFKGLRQVEVDALVAGDIGLIAGLDEILIGDTIVANDSQEALPRIIVESPTLGMIFSINTSPLSGQEGEAVQSRKLRDRLLRFCRYNVALRFQDTATSDQFRVLGRGELQFAIMIEQMRREGMEFMIGRPEVLFQKDEKGNQLEPIERLVLDLPDQYSGEVTEMLQTRKGIMSSYENIGHGRIRLKFEIPTRGILGINSRFKTATRGEGIMSSEFIGYLPFKGDLVHRINGALISDRDGETIPYALESIQERGQLFLDPGVKIYEGMIIGECAKDQDLNVNACREKKLTNHRASGSDGIVMLQGIRKMSLEQCIEWIEDDEWIEVTPESIRLRKKILPQNQRSTKR